MFKILKFELIIGEVLSTKETSQLTTIKKATLPTNSLMASLNKAHLMRIVS